MTAVIVLFALAGQVRDSSLLALVPQVVATAESGAREAARPGAIQGRAIVDRESFVAGLRSVLGRSIDTSEVRRAVGQDVRIVGRPGAVLCEGSPKSCVVDADGAFVTLDSMLLTPAGVRTIVTVEWTDRRPSGRVGIGARQVLLVWRLTEGRWVLAGQSVLRVT